VTVRHVVMLRRHPHVAPEPTTERDLVSRLDELGGLVPGLEGWSVAADQQRRPLCWDYLLDARLRDLEALAAYLAHPLHQALLPDLRAYFELAVVDHEQPAAEEVR
jgi:hypothetical protein